jgi:hypothetical protein
MSFNLLLSLIPLCVLINLNCYITIGSLILSSTHVNIKLLTLFPLSRRVINSGLFKAYNIIPTKKGFSESDKDIYYLKYL